MAAANSQMFPPQDIPAEAAIQEPSMEDILASIRRIIASDQNVASSRGLNTVGKNGAGAGERETSVTAFAVADPVAETPPDSLSAPAFPGLDDLDPLVLPPSPLEPAGHDRPASPVEASILDPRSELHDQLFTVAEPDVSTPRVDDVYELSHDDRLAIDDPEPLISSSVGASVSSSFQTLANTMIMRDPEMLERLARDALRPMLKTWLDDNLPSMVERLVRAEIERVARGGR